MNENNYNKRKSLGQVRHCQDQLIAYLTSQDTNEINQTAKMMNKMISQSTHSKKHKRIMLGLVTLALTDVAEGKIGGKDA